MTNNLQSELVEASIFVSTEEPVFFDIGANEGKYTFEILSRYPKAFVHAFDPDCERDIFKIADPRIRSNAFALSSDSETKKLYKPKGLHSQNAFHYRPHFSQYEVFVENCQCVTVDSCRQSSKIETVDFAKIDTEGHEIDILLGSRESLKNRIIKAGSFEYGETWLEKGRKIADAVTFLNSLNYRVFMISGNSKIELDNKFSDNWNYSNFYFSHSSLG